MQSCESNIQCSINGVVYILTKNEYTALLTYMRKEAAAQNRMKRHQQLKKK